MARLHEKYRKEIVPQIMRELGLKNRFQVPALEKIVVSMGVGAATQDPKLLDAAAGELALITGQRPAVRRARKSISNFKLRAGAPVGCKVTLRGRRMYEFFDRLISVALPRIRDFRGLSRDSFDGRGGYSFGLSEQIVFPEVDIDRVKRIQGMNITLVTSANSSRESMLLLEKLGMPFERR